MPHNENSRVKIPALVHFTRLGYKYISLRKYEGVIDDDTNILVDVLCDAINRINATSLTTTDTQKIVNALKAMLENDDLGREFYSVLINGYNGLKLIDFEDFGGTVNYYHVVTEMTCKNGSDEFRPDITPLINGLPLAFIEVKKPNNKGGIKAEYDRMLMRVKNKKFRRFINLTQIMVFSNNSEYDETVVLLSKGEVDSKKIRVEFSLEDMDMSEFQDGATYPQIKEYVLEHTGLKVSNLYISQIKRKCGIGVGKNYNLPKSEDSRQPQCPQEKEKAIREAFKYFGMI